METLTQTAHDTGSTGLSSKNVTKKEKFGIAGESIGTILLKSR
jgi:hypothetical protein